MKRALFIPGGFAGHLPEKIVEIFSAELHPHGFETVVESTLDCLADTTYLNTFNVVFPCWTMGTLSPEQTKGLSNAVRDGVGLAGVHGGMGDAFRGNISFEWMVGGHFVGHPYIGDYLITVRDPLHTINAGLPASFAYKSEQYYLLVDPGIHVLADAIYNHEDRSCTMPVAWTKHWGKGRVFYNALGHSPTEFSDFPPARTLTTRGILWAAGSI